MMVEILNAKGDAMAGWLLVVTYGRVLLGPPTTDFSCNDRLGPPLYEYAAGIVNNGRQSGIMVQCVPLLLLGSVTSIAMPDGIRIEVDGLSRDEKRRIREAVATADELIASIRRSEAGIVAPPGPLQPAPRG